MHMHTATDATPITLRYGLSEVQFCNVQANIFARINSGSTVRAAVTDALIQEAGFETMPKPSPRQMSDLISFAKAPFTLVAP